MTHESAQDRTLSHEQGSRALPDATGPGEALVQQIAEAIAEAANVVVPHEPANITFARAVLPLVEAQVAPLRDERDDLRTALAELAPSDEVLVEGSFFQRADLPRILGNYMRATDEHGREAKAAESALRQVRELADALGPFGDLSGTATVALDELHHDLPRAIATTYANDVCAVVRNDLLAILDSARVGAADTQPEGAGERRWRDREGDVWTFDQDGIGHSPETADFPREHIEKKWGPLVEVTPTAGSNGDTAPEACAFCRGCHPAELDHCINLPGCRPADTAPESGEGR